MDAAAPKGGDVSLVQPLPDAPAPSANGKPAGDAIGGWYDDGSTGIVKEVPLTELTNYTIQEVECGDKVKQVPVGRKPAAICADLMTITKGWPKRVGPTLFVRDGDEPNYLDRPEELFAWIGQRLEAVQVGPTEDNPLRWATGASMVPRSDFHAHLKQTVERFDAVEHFPHFPAIAGHFYIHKTLPIGNGEKFNCLLNRFSPASDTDRHLLRAFFLSLIWGGLPGTRPAWLFTAAERVDRGGRGIGKSTIAKMAGELVGGYVSARTKDDIGSIIKRLLSPEARGKRMLLLDNLKTLKFSWDELEALVTSDRISGHRMYFGEGNVPNTLSVVLTLNGATLSCDMAQRCIIIELARPEYSGTWEEEVRTYIQEHREQILADMMAELQRPTPPLTKFTRWGQWERDVLARVPFPEECQSVIERRQSSVDGDDAEASLVRTAIAYELDLRGMKPESANVFLPTRWLQEIVIKATGEPLSVVKTTPYLKTLAIRELRETRTSRQNGWTWTGRDAPLGAIPGTLPGLY